MDAHYSAATLIAELAQLRTELERSKAQVWNLERLNEELRERLKLLDETVDVFGNRAA